MDVQPLYDRFLIRRCEGHEQAQAGLFAADAAGEKSDEGRVIAIGRGEPAHDRNIRGLAVALGDRVLFPSHAGAEVRIGRERHLIIREDDVLAIVGSEAL